MSARLIRWIGDRVLAFGDAVDSRCVYVESWHPIRDDLELVRYDLGRDGALYASPSDARVYRLWWWASAWGFWRVLLLLKRCGFWRVRAGYHLHTGWWSYPLQARWMNGYMLKWEARVMARLYRAGKWQTWWRIFGRK